MSFILFDDKGKFSAGREILKTDASSQVELETGRRIKVKTAHVLLRFKEPAPTALMTEAQALAQEIDLDLVWEFAPEGEFSFIDFSKDYYDADATPVQQVAVLFALFGAPHYFRRAGKGCFKKAPEEQVKAALIAIERKKQEQLQIDAWAQELVGGGCSEAINQQLYKILFKPDKNTLEYKAVVQASKQSQVSVLDLFKNSGAIKSPYQFHWKRFLFENFPKGTGFDPSLTPSKMERLKTLPVASVAAFSIDDSMTTEIDDALSVQGLGSGTVTMGVHIAIPGLGIAPEGKVDAVARQRLSTVYMPGWKLPMLPQNMVEAFTLEQGKTCPAISLYVDYDEETLELKSSKSRLEQVPIKLNIRYDLIEDQINAETLSSQTPLAHEFAAELKLLYRLAQHLKAQREEVRGKPETFARPDYTFRLLRDDEEAKTEPLGDEKVSITERQRGSALDLIVSEAMIVANTIWGGLMASVGVPGIYRSQYALRPGVKVRMSTKALPHAGIGVPQYAWSTSPLRRYTDLVNQWQIIACVENGATAALVAPFKPKDVELLSIISAFEATYGGYNDFQRSIERYWVLRYLKQSAQTEIQATIMRNGLLRADDLPLVFEAIGAEAHPKDTVVLVKISHTDELTLEISAQVVQVLKTAGGASVVENENEDEGDDDDEQAAGPIAIAVNLDEESEAQTPEASENSQ